MKEENQICKNCKQNFLILSEDFAFYEKIGVQIPTFCPECRLMRRMAWKNERRLYHRNCNKCNSSVLSIYSSNKPFPIYCNNCWWGDDWDPFEYGLDYNQEEDFFLQFAKLMNSVPHLAIPNFKDVDCEYTTWLDESKGCYMAFGSSRCEDVLFSETLQDCKNSLDLTNCDSVDYSYNCIYCRHSNNLQYCVQCDSCTDCYFSYDLKGCNNCFLSYNLRHKSYMFLNVQYSREEWLEKTKDIIGNREKLEDSLKQFKELFRNSAIHRYANLLKSTQSTGENLEECQNVYTCFDSKRMKDTNYVAYGGFVQECFDAYGIMKSNFCYEFFSGASSYNVVATLASWGDNINVYYSQWILGSQNLFGCHSLRKKSYCILNKQYTKEVYEKIIKIIVEKIKFKGEYGSFFPIQLSPYGYNETVAYSFYPLTKEQALLKGYLWQDDIGGTYNKGTIKTESIPNTIFETQDIITKEVCTCVDCGKNFKIIKKEIILYRRLNIPIPLKCIDCRYSDRLQFSNPRKLSKMQCSCNLKGHNHDLLCKNKFETSYMKDGVEKVFCEKCYQFEVI